MKNKLIAFLKSELSIIISAFIVFAVIYAVFAFSHFELQYVFICIEILTFLLFIYLSIKYFVFNRQLSLKEKLEKCIIEKKELEEQNQKTQTDLKEYFMVWIHQIKTPISVAKILLDKPEDINKSELKNQVFYIEEYCFMAISYLKLIDTGADMDICYVNLDLVIRSLLKKTSLMFINKSIALEYSPLGYKVISDNKWLSILIEQILSNALKYTEQGKIKIYMEGSSLVIADTGIGIRSEDIVKIFDRGYSGYNGRLNTKSSGLGLYLARLIAKKLNISISVESELGVGSKFYIDFSDKLSKL